MPVRSRFALTDRLAIVTRAINARYRVNKGTYFLSRIFLSPPFNYASTSSPFAAGTIIISPIYVKITGIALGDDTAERRENIEESCLMRTRGLNYSSSVLNINDI